MVSPKPRSTPIGGLATSEDAAVQRIRYANRQRFGPPPGDELWIGDDAAVVAPPSTVLLLATDAAVAGVHADLSLVGLDDLGWKAVMATMSDIAAMGGRPLHALVTLCGPPGTDLDALSAGAAQAAAECGCPVVGGDLSTSGQVVAVVAVTGTVDAGGPPAVTRSGARRGDRLFVTGPLGASAAGLRLLRNHDRPAPGDPGEALVEAHRRPRARLAEGWAARGAGVTALMDISDGLSIDLHRMADASGVGFALDSVPQADGATLGEALGGGEDYELLVATGNPGDLSAAFRAGGLRAPVAIGTFTGDPGRRTMGGLALPVTGWQHSFG